jgi:hypothetical protein
MKDQNKWQIEKGEQGSTGVGRAGGAEVKQNTMSLHTNSPHLVSSHINLCNFVSRHWNAGWRKSKRVSRNW